MKSHSLTLSSGLFQRQDRVKTTPGLGVIAGDDAEVVDEVVHPLTLLTACSTSGSVTEGVDEMVEAP